MKVEELDLPERIQEDYLEAGIEELNPPQRKAVDSGLLEGEDMIVASPTASGKTFIAELAMVEKAVKENRTAVYVVPLKALASEKYEDFSDRYEELNVKISVGNRDEAGEYLENADVVIVTSEKLDSMLRHNPSWIHDIGLVVIDEIHLLTSKNRGPTLEVTITRLRELLDFQLLGLSATISNSSKLAEWLKAELVESDYRPVELSHGIYQGNEIEFFTGEEELEEESDELSGWQTGSEVKKEDGGDNYFVDDIHGEPVPNLLEDTLEMDKQAIVFCSSRKGAEKSSDRAAGVNSEKLGREENEQLEEYAEDILNVLGSPTSQCKRLAENVKQGAAFHHAGLCLSGNSLVIHSDGSFSKLEKLMENDIEEAVGLSEYSIEENDIEEKYELDEKPVLEIETGLGRKIKVSKNHKLPILTEEGLDWRKSKNLREEDRIAAPRMLDFEVDKPDLRSLLRDEVRSYRKYDLVDKIAEEIDTDSLEQDFRNRYRKDRNISVGDFREMCKEWGKNPNEHLDIVMSKAGQKPVRIPQKLDKNLAWLIGAIAGDGYIRNSEVNLSGSSKEVLDRFKNIVNEKFGRNVSLVDREKDEVKILKFSSKAVADLLHDNFGIPRDDKANNLRMPDVGLPNQELGSYLRGLFDTDGSVNCRDNSDGAPCIEFYTASEDLATEIHTSLLRFGIIAHRDKRGVNGRKTKIGEHVINTREDIHRVLIYGSDQLRKYRSEIGFTHLKKKSRLDEAIRKNPDSGRRQNDVIPETLGTKVRKIRNQKDLSLSDLEPEVPKSTVSRFENHRNPMKRETFQKLAEKLEHEEIQKIASSDIYWDKIESIKEKEKEKLYDLSTSTQNFIANGLIAHNTTEQRQLIEEAFRKGLLKSVSATPTLAAGVNLPAFRVIIRDLKRYDGNGMNWIPVLEYEQMCLPYDEELLLSDGGRKKIGEIVESDEDFEVLSYNGNEGKLETNQVTKTFYNDRKEIFKVETETGVFRATGNHPILARDDEDDRWLELSELEVGDKIRLGSGKEKSSNPYFFRLLPKDCYVVGNGEILKEYKEEFELKDNEIAEKLDISSSTIYHYKNDKKATPFHGVLKSFEELDYEEQEIAENIEKVKSAYGNTIEVPEKVTEEFMWLLGIILTDGNLNKTDDKRHGSSYTSIRVFNTNKEIIDKTKSIFNSLGLDCYEEEREEGKYRLEVGNTLLAELINEKFEIPYGNKSQNTKIPEIIFKMPENLQASFIEGVYDGDGSYLEMKEEYKRRIHFSTSSKEFANDLRELLAGFGIKSRKDSRFVEEVEIKDQKYEVNEKSYSVRIRDKNSINKLTERINPVKDNIEPEKYSTYNNANKHRKEASKYTEVLNIENKGKEKVYNIEVEKNHNYITSSREVLHNCGRAGRPKYDDRGEAISVAKNPGSVDEIKERYVLGEPERIQSKLNVEPVLRMHTLALVASNFCGSMDELLEFYRKTFYAYQFGDMGVVAEKIRDVVDSLRDYGFIHEDELKATKIGKKVSDLYIDPESAHHMISCLERAEGAETRPISYLFMLSKTSEMAPRLRVKDKEWSDYQAALEDAELYLLEEVPNEWEPGYEVFLESMKTAMMMQSWIQEVDEERIMQEFGTAPGGIRAKMQNADWLLYGAKELMRMKGDYPDTEKDIEKLRIRMKHGIKEELLELVQYNQIGRVRARKLHDHGIRTRSQIREVSFEKLKKLIGKKTAKKLKKQVGQENIFDREDITDWYD